MPVSDIFLTATEMRNNPAFFTPIHQEARAIESAILTAATAGYLDTIVTDTLMTQTALETWQNISAIAVSPTNTFTLTGHGFVTADEIQFKTVGTLPLPISVTGVYFVIKINDNTFKIANSREDALNNVPIAITSSGTGTLQVRKFSISQQFYATWLGQRTDRVKTAQLNAVKNHFTNLGYAISQQTNPYNTATFQWLLSW